MSKTINSMAIIFFTLAFAASSAAQVSVTGSLSGHANDVNGAGIVGASVVLKNVETNAELMTQTGDDGLYWFARVSPGVYRLSIEKIGFQSTIRKNVRVSVNEAATINFELGVAGLETTVTVNENAPLVQTQSVKISQLVDEHRVHDLPLNGKNFQQLITLAPGVGGAGFNTNNPSISGARPSANNYAFDGVNANDERFNSGLAVAGGAAGLSNSAPNLISTEAIREFRVITSNADATFGRSSGGQINLVTKSGSNDYNGSAYGYLRNDRLDARDFFNRGPFFNSDGTAKTPPFRQGLFGATFGGRIIRNKHFFFGSYEGFRQRFEQTASATLPNQTLINLIPGDLGRLYRAYYLDSGLVSTNTSGLFGALPLADRNAALAAGTGFNPTLFDGNAANGEAGTIVVSNTVTRDAVQNSYLVRTDHNFTDKFQASFRYADARPRQTLNDISISGTNIDLERRFQQGVGQFVFTLMPTQILEIRAGFLQTILKNVPQINERFAALGIRREAGINVGVNGSTISNLSVSSVPFAEESLRTPQIAVQHTWTRQNFTLRSGADIRRLDVSQILNATGIPTYRFNGFIGATGLIGANAVQDQANAASVQATVYNGSPERHYRAFQQEYYSQLDWRVRPELTLNIGLRYSYFGVYSERNNRAANLYAVDSSGNIVSGISPFAFGRNSNRIAVAGRDLPLYQPDRNNFQPRLGIAYDIGAKGKTVVRAGYGLYFDRIFQGQFSNIVNNAPFATASLVTATVATRIPFRLGGTTPVNAQTPSIWAIDPTIKNPSTHRFNFAVEQQIFDSTVVTAAYVGARANDLLRGLEPNGSGAVPQTLRPDPRFSDQRFITNFSRSEYDSLQINVHQRFLKLLDLTVAYTFAKMRDDLSADSTTQFERNPTLLNLGATAATGFPPTGNVFEPRPISLDWGASDYDVRHSLVVSHMFEIPIGRGRMFLSTANDLANSVLGGWNLSGIFRYRTGEPFNVTLGRDVNDDGDASRDRPRFVGNTLNELYSGGGARKTQFLVDQSKANILLGNPNDVGRLTDALPRNAFRAPKLAIYDVSLQKRFGVTERIYLQAEINAFNIFNRTNFAAPIANLSDARFGQIVQTRAGTTPRQLQLGLKLNF